MSLLHDMVGALLGAALWLAIARAPLDVPTRRLLHAGFGLAVAACLVRLWVSGKVFGGGDYLAYIREGVAYAAEVTREGPAALLAPERWAPGRWWGAGVVARVAGGVVLLVGPSIVSTSVAFTFLAYVGVVLFVLAYRRAVPDVDTAPYAAWLVLAPSMVYWPAIVGKEALMLLGLGLATWGLAGPVRLRHGVAFGIGLALVFALRPPVAVVFVFALVVMQAVRLARRWTWRRGAATAGVVLAAGLVTALAGRAIATADLAWTGTDFSFFRPGDVLLFLDQKAVASFHGGSTLGDWQDGFSPFGALVDVWLRPFPWTARSVPQAVAAAEVVAFWALVAVRRRAVVAFLRAHGREPLVVFSAVFVAVYGLALGLAMANEGTLVRQRTLMLPFLFVLVTGARRTSPATPTP